MTTSKHIGRLAAAVLLTGAMSFGALAADKAAPAGNGEFDGSTFSCLNYTNGLGENATGKAQSALARTWMQGYLAGYFKGQNKLEMSSDKADEDKLTSVMLQKCREYPQSSILAVSMQAIAKEKVKIPNTAMADFSPAAYTCADHTAAKKSAPTKADVAELWAIAFIQGYKNVAQADMVIGMENKPVLTGAISKNCEKMADTKYMDLVAMVAEKVKM